MLTVLMTVALAIAFVWYLVRQARALLAVRSRIGLASFLNARNSSLQTGMAIASVGASASARDSFDTTHHRATLGIRFLATILAPLLFFAGNTMLLDARGNGTAPEIAPWLGLGLLAFALWFLAYIWTYSIELTGDSIRVPGLHFVRRTYPLDEIVRVDDPGAYFIKVRFRSGRAVEVLRYVAGRATLLEALERRVTLAAEDKCLNSPKSKRFDAALFR